jgi:hypothetical protein
MADATVKIPGLVEDTAGPFITVYVGKDQEGVLEIPREAVKKQAAGAVTVAGDPVVRYEREIAFLHGFLMKHFVGNLSQLIESSPREPKPTVSGPIC